LDIRDRDGIIQGLKGTIQSLNERMILRDEYISSLRKALTVWQKYEAPSCFAGGFILGGIIVYYIMK